MWDLAPDHAPGLVGGLLAALAWLLGVRLATSQRFRRRYEAAPGSVRAAALLMVVTAGVHLALVPHHLDSLVTSLLFVVNAAAFTTVAVAALSAWWWRPAAAVLLVATVLAYLFYLVAGREGPDQVGIATKLVELTALGLVLVPVPQEQRPAHRGLRWAAVAVAIPTLTVLTGLTVWGVDLVRPAGGHHNNAVLQATSSFPTPQQQEQADRLLSETSAAIAHYQDWRVARAAGYRPTGLDSGAVVHWVNPAYASGPILEPGRPQALVYVRGRSGWVLAGAMFEMPGRGQVGPDPGGPLTAWHVHRNICFSPIGPAITFATPYAGCPLGAVAMSSSAMLHVWIVDNPTGGPFAADLDPKMIRALQRA